MAWHGMDRECIGERTVKEGELRTHGVAVLVGGGEETT